jgi:hypothetical protein
MKLKTSPTLAVERGKPVENSHDIELLGAEALCGCSDQSLHLAIKSKTLTNKSNCFCKVFGFKSKFYYNISLRERYEVGIGYLEKKNKHLFLKRSLPLFYTDNGTDVIPSYNLPRTFYCSDADYLVISSYTPRTYIELLPDANSLITSIDAFVPSSLHVDKNSVVARLDDHIVSLSLEDLFNTEQFKEAVKNITERS